VLIKTFIILAKTTAESFPVDNLLFDSFFDKEIKKAATMKKAFKDIVSTPLTILKKVQQPIKHITQSAFPRARSKNFPCIEVEGDKENRGIRHSSRHKSYHHRFRFKRC